LGDEQDALIMLVELGRWKDGKRWTAAYMLRQLIERLDGFTLTLSNTSSKISSKCNFQAKYFTKKVVCQISNDKTMLNTKVLW